MPLKCLLFLYAYLFIKVHEQIFIEYPLYARQFFQLLVYLSEQNEDLDTIRTYILDKNAYNKHKHNKEVYYIAC